MKSILAVVSIFVVFSVGYAKADAAFRLPAVISDHMILQAGQPDAIWGWAPAGAAVKIDFVDGQGKNLAHADATAGEDGRWSAQLPALTAGTVGELQVAAGSDAKTIHDVLVGEDWLCGGQSNMSYRVKAFNSTPAILATASQEATAAKGEIRYFNVINVNSPTPLDDVKGSWTVTTPDNVGDCSSVAWNFGVQMHDKLHCPVGLVHSSVGGTPAEAWMPKDILDSLSVGPGIEKRMAARMAALPAATEKYKAALAHWLTTKKGQLNDDISRPKDPRMQAEHNSPGGFYNGMIHGLAPYSVRGILWYQADGNSGDYQDYPELITALIKAWRADWKAELPFYYVEMNNMWELQEKPVDTSRNLGALREAQEAALTLPKTGVETAIDLAAREAIANPHFSNKKPLGIRLANLALEEVYGMNLGEVHSPEFASYKVEGNQIRLSFRHAEGLRTRGGGPLKGFAIRGATGDWVWADGKIDGQDIVVSSAKIPNPAAVRYCWAPNPMLWISVENGAGLPLRPFRTDKGSTP